MSVVLACDLGSTNVRAALVDAQGCVQAHHARSCPIPDAVGGVSELAPGLWWDEFLRAAAALALDAPGLFATVAGIAVCGLTRTHILLDAHDQPLGHAITWKDTRGADIARRTAGRFAGHPEAAALAASHPFARLAWLHAHEPARFPDVACVLEPKDYLNLRLTGRRASDPVSSARLVAASVPADLFAAIGLSAAILPPLREPWECIGPVQPGLPAPLDRLAGVPVFCGSNDSWVAALGLGAMRPGYAYNISGTTEVLGVVGPAAKAAQGLLTVDWRGLFQLGGPSQNGADVVPWLLSLLEAPQEVGQGIGRLLSRRRQDQPVLFLPYLQGERTPYWDPNLRGAFVGLSQAHGAPDLAWAVLEGIAFLNRVVLDRAEAAFGEAVVEIRLGGGGAANAVWPQVKADVCRRPVVLGAAEEPGVLGSALLAWTGLGRFPNLVAAQEATVRSARRFVPDAARADRYDRLYGMFRDAERALMPISHALAAFP